MNILITGGSGFLGNHLITHAEKEGHIVSILSRSAGNANSFYWNPDDGTIDEHALTQTDCIIHLAGASLAEGHWTAKRKKEIIGSRVKSGEVLYEYLKKNKSGMCGIKTFISASGIGIYGNKGDEWVNESTPPATDFLGEVCQAWEAMTDKIASLGIRVVILRIGVVLAKDGGALPVIAKPVKLFAGAALGSGKQYMSWIHVDDLCAIFLKAAADGSMQNVYNAVAPDSQTNAAFTKALAHALKKPLLLPNIPAFVMRLLLGEKAAIALDGQRVSSKKILSAGFQFQFSELNEALNNIYGN